MSPVQKTIPKRPDQKLLSVKSAAFAAHLQLAGHAVAGVREVQGRDVFYFERSAEPEFLRLMRAFDVLRADAERVRGGRR